MAEKKEETPEEKRRMLDFAHESAQIASAETIADMTSTVPILQGDDQPTKPETRKG